MRKIVILVILTIIISSVIPAQTIIENPRKPLSKNPGRIVKLREIMRIRDDGGEIVFRGPYGLQIGHDGSIYFYDDWKLYKFSSEGKFVFKIIENGQGPGEAITRTSYLLTKNEIIIQAINPPKIMRFDLQGSLKDEKRTELARTFDFIGFSENKIYGFSEGEIPQEAFGKEGFFDFPSYLYEIAPDFSSSSKKFSFAIKHYVISGAWWPRAKLDFAFKDNENLFITHTPEYQIIKFNIEKNTVEGIFKRAYDRIKYPQKARKLPPGSLSPPPYKYYSDISKILIYKDQLWAFTSTRDKQNRRLVDVYNMNGEYTDNFYLEFPENITPRSFAYGTIVLRDGYIYTIDEHSGGYMSIAKYKLEY